MGSWGYMSPEQWADSPDLGPAADLYALGVVAFELLTGHLPFVGEDADEYAMHHRHKLVIGVNYFCRLTTTILAGPATG